MLGGSPAADLGSGVDHRIVLVGRPLQAVGRVVEALPHPRLDSRLPGGGSRALRPHGLVALGGIGFVLVPKERDQHAARQEVVVAGALELHLAQVGFLPMDAVPGGGVAEEPILPAGILFVAVDLLHLAPDGFPVGHAPVPTIGPESIRAPLLGLERSGGPVPHPVHALIRVVDQPLEPDVVTLPGPVLLQKGICRMFHGRVEDLLGVAETLDDVVVDEELLVPADMKQALRSRRRRARHDKPCRQDTREASRQPVSAHEGDPPMSLFDHPKRLCCICRPPCIKLWTTKTGCQETRIGNRASRIRVWIRTRVS